MPVYNGSKYLKEAIESVLNQTFRDFELLIINDGSIDNSLDVIKGFKDTRIKVINNARNRGIPYSRNLGLREAKGEYLAWSDCDDINLPHRFEKQIRFLLSHREFGACGTWLASFGSNRSGFFKAYKDPELVRTTLLFKPSMPNATVMLRLAEVRQFGLKYNEKLPIAEDYDFVLRCSRHFPLTNIREVLYLYRASDTSIMKKYEAQQKESDNIHKIIHTEALEYIGIEPTENQLITHRLISSEKLLENFSELVACYDWLKLIKEHNDRTRMFDQNIMNRVLAEQFLFACKKASWLGLKTFNYYLSKIPGFGLPRIDKLGKLALRCSIQYNKF